MEQTLEFLFINLPGVTFLKAHSWDPRECSQIWRLWICLLICYLKLHYVRIFNLIFAFKMKACDNLGFIYVLKQSNFSWITPFRHTRWQLKGTWSDINHMVDINPNFPAHEQYLKFPVQRNITIVRKGVPESPPFLRHPPLDPACPPPFFKIFVFPPLLSVPPLLRYLRQFPPPSHNAILP